MSEDLPSHETYKSAKNLALHRLSQKEYSSKELQRYLIRKGYPDLIIASLIEDLKDRQYLDDQRYARVLVRYQANRGKGSQYIRQKLAEKGISMDVQVIYQIIEESTQTTELDNALRFLERKFSELKEDRTEIARAYQALLRRGFTFEIAKTAVQSKIRQQKNFHSE